MKTLGFFVLWVFLLVCDVVTAWRARRRAGAYYEPGDGIGWEDEY